MMTDSEIMLDARIFAQARLMATDEELCKACSVTPAEIEDYRGTIEQARTEALVSVRFERARRHGTAISRKLRYGLSEGIRIAVSIRHRNPSSCSLCRFATT